MVRVAVTDEGAGFAPEDSERLFAPWDRGRRSGTPGGTGLGLYLARSILREAGGDLLASSRGPGRGATFTLLLPTTEAA
jgi:signal transduction histidine kinase